MITTMVSVFCVKCKTKRDIPESELQKTTVGKSNRPALKGNCPVCETVVFKFVKG